MKKVLSFVLCCVVFASAFAQHAFTKNEVIKSELVKKLNLRPAEKMAMNASYNYAMSSYNTDDYYITCTYTYDAQHRLISVYENVPSEYKLKDSIRYNEQNQLVRLDGYQLLYGQWKLVYYIEYTYSLNSHYTQV